MRLLYVYALFALSMVYAADADKQTNEEIFNLNKFLQVYKLSIQEDDQRIGKMQFKVYKGRGQITCVIDYIIIEPHKRRQGNGDILLDIALKKIRELGCNVIKTQIDIDNDASLALFEKNGFECTQQKPIRGTIVRLQKNVHP